MMGTKTISRHKGLLIQQNEDGYFWDNGPDSGGYFDTIEECAADIDDYFSSSEDDDIPDDTPCLEAPWWEAA